MGLFSAPDTAVLMVCTANICRSPMAEGLLRHHLDLAGLSGGVSVGSAGTHTSRPGARPDQRALRIASDAGVNLRGIRARRVTEKDLINCDLVFAMDRSHIRHLGSMCPPGNEHKISLLLNDADGQGLEEVPDPYYGSYEDFISVFQIIDRATANLLTHFGKSSD